jgi:hypothetical protein
MVMSRGEYKYGTTASTDHGQTEIVTSGSTSANCHLNRTHYGSNIWFVEFSDASLWSCSHAYPLSVVLYKRLVLGEPQRKLPRPGERDSDRKIIEFHQEEPSNDHGERQS